MTLRNELFATLSALRNTITQYINTFEHIDRGAVATSATNKPRLLLMYDFSYL